MPTVIDFRRASLDLARVNKSGRHIGSRVYWKLYAVENLVRIIIHSVLSVQVIPPPWWAVAVDLKTQRKVGRIQADYALSPRYSTPGRHDIYYLFLPDLHEIMRVHRHLFVDFVPQVDRLLINLDLVRLPRNLVGHMNWPKAYDRQRIDLAYTHARRLIRDLRTSKFSLLIP